MRSYKCSYRSTQNVRNPRNLVRRLYIVSRSQTHGYTRRPIRSIFIRFVLSRPFHFFFSIFFSHAFLLCYIIAYRYYYLNDNNNILARAPKHSVGPSTTPFPAFPAHDVTPCILRCVQQRL